MKIGFASDHAGFSLKERLKAWALEQGHEVVDFGTHGSDSVDYPDFAVRVRVVLPKTLPCRPPGMWKPASALRPLEKNMTRF